MIDQASRAGTLLGRAHELRALDALVDGPGGGAAVVHGPAGIGKSAVLAAVREHAAARGRTVLATAGVQSEASLPYAALERLVRPLLDRAPALAGPQREALLSAVGLAGAAVTDRFLIGLATLNLLADCGPVVALVDDVHWLDAATADVLAFVARRIEAEPIVLVVGGPDGSLPFSALDVPLGPLDDASARGLLERSGGALTATARRRVLATAAGNPLALVELPRTGEDALPLTERLERSFSAQAADLSPTTRALLRAAAADDGDAAAEILAAARQLAPDAGDADVEAAIATRLLERDGDRLRFRHPLIRSALQQAASAADRRAAHAAVAETIADDPHRRAWHRAAACGAPDEAVATALDAAAEDARRRGAVAVAARALRRAAELSTVREHARDRLLAAAELSAELGEVDTVVALVAEAETLDPDPFGAATAAARARDAGPPAAVGTATAPLGARDPGPPAAGDLATAPAGAGESATLARARIRWLRESFAEDASDDVAHVRALVADADRAGAAGDLDLALKLLLAAGTRCWWAVAADAPVRDEVVAQTLRTGVGDDDPRVIAVLAATSAVRHAALVIERLERVCDEPRTEPMGAHLLGQAAHMVGHSELAVRQLSRVEAQWRAQGRLALLAQALVMRAWSSIQLGNWPAVEPAAAEGERLASETGQPLWAAGARAALAAAAGVRGGYERGMAAAADVEAQLMAARPTNVFAVLQVARGVTALGGGRYSEAYDQFARMFDAGDPAHHYAECHGGLSYLAEAALQCGRTAQARAVLERFEPLEAPATLLRIGVEVARPLVAADPRDETFEAALAGRAATLPFHRARVLLAYGGWLRRRRRVADSRAPLRTARDLFDALGTVPWSERARQELRASGETSPRRGSEARDELTPQELQIVQLAASGLTNPEIGERLFLSARTISSHLYRAFPKLGVASRAELAGVLRGAN